MSSIEPTGNKARVARYRANHHRIDYAPMPDVLQIIEHHLNNKLDKYRAGVIDQLIRAGHRAVTMSGNGER